MYPWLWFWAPQLHFPLSGAVTQRIAPRTQWFEQHIPENAGNAELEAKITEVASYGKQLGWLMKAVLGLADSGQVTQGESQEALQNLEALQLKVREVKTAYELASTDAVLRAVQACKEQGGEEYQRLLLGLRAVLGE